MTSFNIYLLFLVGKIDICFKVFFVITALGALIAGGSWVIHFIDECEEEKSAWIKTGKKLLKVFIIILSISMGGMVFCPSTEQIAIIYLLPKLSNTKLVQTLPQYAQTFLDLEIKKLKKEAAGDK